MSQCYLGPRLWTKLPKSIRDVTTLTSFKSKIRQLNISELLDDGCTGCSLCFILTSVYFYYKSLNELTIDILPTTVYSFVYSPLIGVPKLVRDLFPG